jgi:hypothetical protein
MGQARYRARSGTRTVRSYNSGLGTNVTGNAMQKGEQARGKSPSPEETANGWDLQSDTEEKKEGLVETSSSKEAFWQSELFRA